MKIGKLAGQFFATAPVHMEHTEDGSALRILTIDTQTADVELRPGTDADLTAILSGAVSESVQDDVHLDVLWEHEDTLSIRVHTGAKRIIGFNSLNLAVTVPDKLYESVRVHMVTGDLEARGLRAQTLDFHVTTGDVSVETCLADVCLVRTTTGDVNLGGVTRDLQAETVTGDLTIGSDCQTLHARVVTGDVTARLKRAPENTAVSCVTGDASVHLAAEPEAMTVSLATVTGSVRADTAALGTSAGKRRWSGAVGKGGPQMTIHCTTGDIEFTTGGL